MAASQTDVSVSAPPKSDLNKDENHVINSLMYLKAKKHNTSTENIYKVCQNDYGIERNLFDSILNNLNLDRKGGEENAFWKDSSQIVI